MEAFVESLKDGNPQSVLLLAACYFAAVCSYSLIYQLRMRRWPSVQGRLRSVAVERFGAASMIPSDTDYHDNALYDYEVDGVSYSGSKLSAWTVVASHNMKFILEKRVANYLARSGAKPGGEVAVYYSPSRPKKSVLMLPGYPGMLFTLTMALFPTVLYVIQYW